MSLSIRINIIRNSFGISKIFKKDVKKDIKHYCTESGRFSQLKHCPYCKGNLYTKCYTCCGSGKLYLNGMKEYLCDDCGGRGNDICRMCRGSGKNPIL
jgi:hypothetical protein